MALSRALGLERPAYVGCSMGGVLALHLALEHPTEFRAIIGLESADVTPGFYLDWWNHPAVEGGSVAASVIEGLIAPQTSEVDRRLSMWYCSQAAPGVLKGDLYFYSVDHDMTETVGQIDTAKVPLFLLTGEYDYLSTPDQTIATAAKIPGAHVQVMPELGHFPMSEDHTTFMTHLGPILDVIAETE